MSMSKVRLGEDATRIASEEIKPASERYRVRECETTSRFGERGIVRLEDLGRTKKKNWEIRVSGFSNLGS